MCLTIFVTLTLFFYFILHTFSLITKQYSNTINRDGALLEQKWGDILCIQLYLCFIAFYMTLNSLPIKRPWATTKNCTWRLLSKPLDCCHHCLNYHCVVIQVLKQHWQKKALVTVKNWHIWLFNSISQTEAKPEEKSTTWGPQQWSPLWYAAERRYKTVSATVTWGAPSGSSLAGTPFPQRRLSLLNICWHICPDHRQNQPVTLLTPARYSFLYYRTSNSTQKCVFLTVTSLIWASLQRGVCAKFEKAVFICWIGKMSLCSP